MNQTVNKELFYSGTKENMYSTNDLKNLLSSISPSMKMTKVPSQYNETVSNSPPDRTEYGCLFRRYHHHSTSTVKKSKDYNPKAF